MIRRIVSVSLVILIGLMATLSALGAMSLSNFSRGRIYNGEFSDISPDAWYYADVVKAYEYGLMDGKVGGVFDPAGKISIAETIKLAAILHKGYYTGSTEFEQGSPWYAPYIEYALKNSIPVGERRNYNAAATRADFAVIISGALPYEAITPINRIANGAIPDVVESYSYGPDVYRLYRAGVLVGSDDEGTFFPGRSISRAESAKVLTRVVDADTRVPFIPIVELTAEQIYKRASPAVFYIEIFNKDNKLLKTGSGFFITKSGIAITNYHVVIGGHSALITTDDGTIMKVEGIYDYDWKNDLALIQVQGEGFSYLELADSSLLKTGATVYTLGSPLGLQASFTKGIVSQALREIDGTQYIQLDAPISSGSSGGALLVSSGKVVGVTSATAIDAQNINLAMPINALAGLSREKQVSLESILIPTIYYKSYYPAPDFGAFFGVVPFDTKTSRDSASYSYKLSDLPRDEKEIIDEYTHLIMQNLFDILRYTDNEDSAMKTYYNPWYDIMLKCGIEKVYAEECFTITVS